MKYNLQELKYQVQIENELLTRRQILILIDQAKELEAGKHLIARLYRVVMVTTRGWPPPHLDADGDWNPTKDDDKQTTTVSKETYRDRSLGG